MVISGVDDEIEINIHHGLDAMLTPEGDAFEFHYNYLAYTFSRSGEEILAKHYMDQSDQVSLLTIASLPLSQFMRRVLVFLRLRYGKIDMLTDKGYLPLPDDILRTIEKDILYQLRYESS